nr:hypothetical protein [Tanacetum cinerariifolium]
MILNTLDNLGKFKAKGDEGYFLGYSMSSKAIRVFNKRTKMVEENLHIEFLENKAIEKGSGPNWLFDIDSLTKSMNYVPVVDACTNSTNFSGTKVDAIQDVKKDVSSLRYIVLPNWVHEEHLESPSRQPQDACKTDAPESSENLNLTATSTNPPTDKLETLTVETLIPTFEDILRVTTNSEESNGVEADVSNMETTITASPTPTLRIHSDHPKSQIIGPVDTLIQTRDKSKEVGEQKPKKISDALQDPSWVEAIQEELLQFKIQKKQSQTSGSRHTQEEGIDYDEVFAPIVRIEAIRLFLAYASFMGFIVYQMDVKSAFLYGTIDEEVYVMQPLRFQDPEYPARVYKVEKAIRQRGDFILVQVYVDDIIFGSSNPQLCREFKALMHENFEMSAMGELNFFLGLQVLQKEDDIFLSQDKYSNVRSSNTPMDKENPWGKDGTGKDVDLHLYRSMIGSLMYLTASRPDIMFASHHKLGLWYPKDSPFDLVAYSDSKYGGSTQDHKSTTRGCQFFGRRLISWQCKKQTIVAISTTEAEYVAAASCCGQVLLSLPCENLSKEISTSILHLLHTAKTFDLVWIWLGGDYGNIFLNRVVPLFDTMLIHQGEGSGTPTEPHHTPSQEAQPSSHTHISSPSIPTVTSVPTIPIPSATLSETTPIRQYTRRARIAQSSALPPVADEPASPVRDVSQGEACPTDSGFIPDQDRATIAKSSTLPHDSTLWVTSPAAEEGKINRLKERVKILEDKEGVIRDRSRDDAPIKGRRIDEEEVATERVSSDTKEVRLDEGEVAAERASEDTEEMATVLTTMDATTVLASAVVDVPTGSGSIPTTSTPAEGSVPTGSEEVPTASPVFTTATVVTPYRRRKGKEVMRRAKQIARDAEIARIHAEEELQSMIDGLDSNNETVAKYLEEYRHFSSELPMERRIELISDLVKYQDNYTKVYKFQSQQKKSWTKKQKRDYYMAVIRNNLGWKVKDFKGMTFEEVEAKFNSVCKQMEDFIPIGLKEEAERIKRKGINLEQESAKKQKSSEEITEEAKSPEEVTEKKINEMMQLVPIEEVYVEALQFKHPIIDWEVHTEGQRAYWKITRLGGSSASYQFFTDLLKHLDRDDLNQLGSLVKEISAKDQPPNFIHAPAEWKLYDKCGVHQVTLKEKDIFMLVEKDYPLRKGLAFVMICYKLQVENYSKMADDLVWKIYNIANSTRQQSD